MSYDEDDKYYHELSNLTKSKMTKSIWIEVREHFELWKVEKLIKPNKFQTFIVLSYEPDDYRASYFYEKNKKDTKQIYMRIIENRNYDWYNNTQKVAEIMEKINKMYSGIENKKVELRKTMYRKWLEK